MKARTALLALLAAVIAVGWAGLPGFSTAAFTATTTSTAQVTTAADWTPPVVVLDAPAFVLRDTVTLTAAATDAETGVKTVRFDFLAPGASSWAEVCTATQAPFSCEWNTKPLADGSYGMRATATDNAGYSATSEALRATVANNVLVALGDVADAVRGTPTLSAAVHNAGALGYTLRIEYSAADANKWTGICTSMNPPFSCSWNTGALANDFYDLRAVAVLGGSIFYSAIAEDVLVDNQAPTISMTDPGSPLAGVRTFQAKASDAHSGIAQTVLQYAPFGAGSYKDLCTVNTAPHSCRFDTRALPDGSYSFRAVATDVAGNSTVSTPISSRLVDNNASAVSMENPGVYLTGTVTLSAAASSKAGVTSVTIQRSTSGTSAWTDICADATSPYGCSWNSATVVNGFYDFRAVLLDGTGKSTTSDATSGHQVDNTPLRGFDVQAANGGAVGKLQPGDSITYTYNQQVNLSSITPGWTGAPQAVTVRLQDGALLGLGATGDTLDVQRSGSAVNLGSVNLKQNFVKANKTAQFNATMRAGTTTVNGVQATTVTVALNNTGSGSNNLRTASAAANMVWAPSAAALDLKGNAASTAPVIEGGPLDIDF
ncbi:Ig-like domain-containing protein [Arthrobacter sulfonylureivorans]|uniref:Ig-like domain-containing protein n=1 Tax=Arthrobacter sulfonylureivorans TaxID=2486855 RepID=A0ABY3WAD9_9MICC|nr:Ig-like domain-containing protein [Arthrobacter sulfonylureivorans]UNK45548.1 Ig-like domain-containing protein [Arthrobacter sulfonylureivorans]